MAGIAQLALKKGYRVTGSDSHYHDPIYSQLKGLSKTYDLTLFEGHAYKDISPSTSMIIVGNVMTRGMQVIEDMLIGSIPYTSGPQWMGSHILNGKKVIAIAGTHGKTTTTALVSFILQSCKIDCGYLIGGIPLNNNLTHAHLGTDYFVIEADEYDSAFFDKRSKFIHYKPTTLLINNLEFDHADIFESIEDIQTQFHFLIRTMSAKTNIFARSVPFIKQLIAKGCWSNLVWLQSKQHWYAYKSNHHIIITFKNKVISRLSLTEYPSLEISCNSENVLSAYAICTQLGVSVTDIEKYLKEFKQVTRRMQKIYESPSIVVYEDFAHHPTSIKISLEYLKNSFKPDDTGIVIEMGSNSMKMGTWEQKLQLLTKPYKAKLLSKTPLAVVSKKTLGALLNSVNAQGSKKKKAIIIMSNKNIDPLRVKILELVKSYERKK